MADTNADNWSVAGTRIATNPDTVDISTGLNGSLAGSTLSITTSVPKTIVKTQTCAVEDFTDNEDATGTLISDITLPIGAILKQAYLTQVVGFAGDTSAVITIGDGTDVDRYNTGTPNVFTTADEISTGVPSGVGYHAAAKTVTLIITGATDFTSIVTEGNGTLELTVEYIQTV